MHSKSADNTCFDKIAGVLSAVLQSLWGEHCGMVSLIGIVIRHHSLLVQPGTRIPVYPVKGDAFDIVIAGQRSGLKERVNHLAERPVRARFGAKEGNPG